MCPRPLLSSDLDAEVFRQYYYLKKELVIFCQEHALSVAGNKQELTERIICFLRTGMKTKSANRRKIVRKQIGEITLQTLIEPDVVCSEQHRTFFKRTIGTSFTFRVAFQKWLKTHAGSTYAEAIQAWYALQEKPAEIDRQFEYNTYIRDFFRNNPGKSLQEAILCWNEKKKRSGTRCYEPEDLAALEGIRLN